MVNNKLYKKCLEKLNVDKYKENEIFTKELKHYKKEIVKIVDTLFEDFIRHQKSEHFTNSVNSTFHSFIESCIEFIKNNPKDGCDNDEMFCTGTGDNRAIGRNGRVAVRSGASEREYDKKPKSHTPSNYIASALPNSFWGKQIHKM